MEVSAIKTINANNLSFSYLELGEGPLVLCLHGFPDTAHTWQYLMPVLAQAGFRVVAPFMRGYPPTALPQDNDYSAVKLGADVSALISAFGADQAILIGHDWGALAVYAAANLHPEKVAKMVTVAIPHPRSIRLSPAAAWKSRHFFTFQLRRWACWQLRRNNFAYVDSIYKRWSPTWDFPPYETALIKEALAKPGAVEAVLGYYWSFASDRNNQDVQNLLRKKTTVPTLCLVGAADGALNVESMPETPRAFTGPYDYKVLPQVGHFLHREVPDEFVALVVDYLMG